MNVRVVDSSECWRLEAGEWCHEFRFVFPYSETVKNWPVEARDARREALSVVMASELDATETGGGQVLLERTGIKPFSDHWVGSS
jgi:hypothetical protein